MTTETLIHLNTITTHPRHQPYIECIPNSITLPYRVGYAIKQDTSYFSLVSTESRTFPYPFVIIDCSSFIEELITIASIHHAASWNVYTKLSFLNQALSDINNRQATATLLPHLGLSSHPKALTEYVHMLSLPPKLLKFASSKNMTVHQLKQLCRFDSSLLEWFTTTLLPLCDPSCGIFLELIESCHDLYKRNNQQINTLASQLNLNQIPQPTTSHSVIQYLRHHLHQLRYPIQTQSNAELENQLTHANLEDNMSLHWDKTLENKGLTIQLKYTQEKDLQQLDTLSRYKHALKDMLALMDYE